MGWGNIAKEIGLKSLGSVISEIKKAEASLSKTPATGASKKGTKGEGIGKETSKDRGPTEGRGKGDSSDKGRDASQGGNRGGSSSSGGGGKK